MAAEKNKGYYTIGDISKIYGIGTDSLRYYEEKGLITPERSPSGYRLYRDTDIWRLNVIGELRGFGMSVDNIRRYLESGSVQGTVSILTEELRELDKKIAELHETKNRLQSVVDSVLATQNISFETVTTKHFPERRAFRLDRRFSADEDMDKIMKQLTANHSRGIIGNHQIAAVLTPMFDHEALYQGALLLDDNGPYVIPEGDYLSIFYSGVWDSRNHAGILMDYARSRNIRLDTEYMDLIWLDIHTSINTADHISEVQARIRGR